MNTSLSRTRNWNSQNFVPPQQPIYFLSRPETSALENKADILGVTGVKLDAFIKLGLPTPPGFIISAEISPAMIAANEIPDWFRGSFQNAIRQLEEVTNKKVGDPTNPLILSLRSSKTKQIKLEKSMHFFNVGLNEEIMKNCRLPNAHPAFLYNCYANLLFFYGTVVLGLPADGYFEAVIRAKQLFPNSPSSNDTMSVEQFALLIKDFERLSVHKAQSGDSQGSPWGSLWQVASYEFPSDPMQQIEDILLACYREWGKNSAGLADQQSDADSGNLAIIVQEMVFGNYNTDSASGTTYSRNVMTGEKETSGFYQTLTQNLRLPLNFTQPKDLKKIEQDFPEDCHSKLHSYHNALEFFFRSVKEVDFVIQDKKLWILNTEEASLSTNATFRVAAEMHKEKLIDEKGLFEKIKNQQFRELLSPLVDKQRADTAIAQGEPVVSGAITGHVVFDGKSAIFNHERGLAVVLVKKEHLTSEVLVAFDNIGLLTKHGSQHSPAAKAARKYHTPCVVGCDAIEIDPSHEFMHIGGKKISKNDVITIDGSSGAVYLGEQPRFLPELDAAFYEIMKMTSKSRRMKIYANLHDVEGVKLVRKFGAEGVGVFDTDWMFSGSDRVLYPRLALLEENYAERKDRLRSLLPKISGDFSNILDNTGDLPVFFRFFDPPLHELLPRDPVEVEHLAKVYGTDQSTMWTMLRAQFGFNSVLCVRGARTVFNNPEFYLLQTRALASVYADRLTAKKPCYPGILLSYITNAQEFGLIRALLEKEVANVLVEKKTSFNIPIGAVISVPSAVWSIDAIAEKADFLVVDLFALTQFFLGATKTDTALLMERYVNFKVFAANPFDSVERSIGQFLRTMMEKLKQSKKAVPVFASGGQINDISTIEMLEELGFSGIISDPYNVPINKLSASLVALGDKEEN